MYNDVISTFHCFNIRILAPEFCDACPNVQIGLTIRMRKKRSDISSLSMPELCSCEMNKGYALSFVPGVLQIRTHSWKNCRAYIHERKHIIISLYNLQPQITFLYTEFIIWQLEYQKIHASVCQPTMWYSILIFASVQKYIKTLRTYFLPKSYWITSS